MPKLIQPSIQTFSIRLLLALIALCCVCFVLVGCDDETRTSEDTAASDIEGLNAETPDAEPSTESPGPEVTSEPIIVTIENANDLSLDSEVQVTALLTSLRMTHDGYSTSFILNLSGEKYHSYDIHGVLPIEYKQIVSDYPDIHAGLTQSGWDKRDYIMTVIGDFAGYRIGDETGAKIGFNIENCEMISLVPAE